MYCENSTFPGLNADGGFAEYLVTDGVTVVTDGPNIGGKNP